LVILTPGQPTVWVLSAGRIEWRHAFSLDIT
jgi:hypothetical protein